MMGEILPHEDLKIYQEIGMPDGGRIILANPAYGWIDRSVDGANHNVFRVDRSSHVVWQVRREERGCVNWEVRNRHAKEDNPFSEGYLDPFNAMSKTFFERRVLLYRPFHPTTEEILFDKYAPGRLLWLITSRWAYDLDPETGIATNIGEQVK